MSFKEVSALRKEGKLEEALALATQDLEGDPENVWNKRAISWVYYDFLKHDAEQDHLEACVEHLEKIKDLNLSEEEDMLFDQVAWKVGKVIYTLGKAEQVDYEIANRIFDCIQRFHFTKPSAGYSFLLKAFLKLNKDWNRFIGFCDWWNLDNFQAEDYLPEEFDGKRMMPLAEQAYVAYSRKLVAQLKVPFSSSRDALKQKIIEFLPRLDHITEAHPEYQYPAYYKAKLLIGTGDQDNVLSAFIPFARQKRNDFWVWDLLADHFQSDREKRFACLCKALSLNSPEEYLGKVRQKFIQELINKENYPAARLEIDQLLQVREDKGWKIPGKVQSWISSEWYKSTEAAKSNTGLYKSHIAIAEELLYADMPEETIVIDFVNRDKKMIHFIDGEKQQGFFKYGNMKFRVGDVLKVRLERKGDSGFCHALSVKPTDAEAPDSIVKAFSGKFTVHPNKTIGFIGDVLVVLRDFASTNLNDGELVQGQAIASYNKKKEEWGWKAIKVTSPS